MKPLLLIIFSFYLNAYGQEKTIFKTWSGKELDYIKIDSNHVYFEMSGSYLQEKRYFIIDDTLRLYDKYTSSRDNYSKYHIDDFNFLIKKLSSAELILLPLDSNAKKISNGKNELKYIDRKNVIDSKFKFNQIKYNIFGGAWEWVNISILIDDKKNFKYINKNIRAKPEYYYGKLSEENYNELIRILKSSKINDLTGFKQVVYDVPETTLEIDYNGKSKQIKQYILPAITHELVKFILALPKQVPLSKTDPFEISFRSK